MALAPILLVVAAPTSWWTLARSARVFEAVPEAELARCDASPTMWSYTSRTGVRAWALDPGTLSPMATGMPATTAPIRLRLAAGESEPVAYGVERATMVLRRDAPCTLVAVEWPLDGDVFRSFVLLVVAVLGPVLMAAAWFATWLFVRPLLAMLQSLDRSSQTLGTSDYRSPEVLDDLAPLQTALDGAHTRILEDREQLDAQRRWLEQHIADVAHDLRTPLASLQLRLERVADGDVEATRGAMADVTYLTMLTENLALAGQLRSGLREDADAVDVAAIAIRVTERFALLGRRFEREVLAAVPDDPVRLETTALYLEQILNNLVHNAVHHHDGPGTVVVVVEPGPPLIIEVCDDGPATPSSLPGERAPAGATHGLGLSIVHTLAEHIGAEVELGANEPRGLVVRLRFRSPDRGPNE